jgi:hypothetical protein
MGFLPVMFPAAGGSSCSLCSLSRWPYCWLLACPVAMRRSVTRPTRFVSACQHRRWASGTASRPGLGPGPLGAGTVPVTWATARLCWHTPECPGFTAGSAIILAATERPTRGQGPGRHRPESPCRSPRRRSHRDRPAPRPAARHRPLLPLRPAHHRVRPTGSPLCDRCRTGRASRPARPPTTPSLSGRRRSPVTRWPDLRISVP